MSDHISLNVVNMTY